MYGLPALLTVLFVILKVFGVIAWSWWLVFAPALVSVGLGLLMIAMLITGAAVVALAK